MFKCILFTTYNIVNERLTYILCFIIDKAICFLESINVHRMYAKMSVFKKWKSKPYCLINVGYDPSNKWA